MGFMKYTLPIVAVLMLLGCQQKDEIVLQQQSPTVAKPQTEASIKVMVSITPSSPRRNECMQVTTDAYGDIRYEWYRNGILLADQTSERLCDSESKKGTDYQAVIITENGRFSSEVTMANAPPRITNVRAEPDRVIHGMPLTVVPVATDVDGDEVSYRYQWYVNGEPVATETSATLAGDAFGKGDILSVEIVPLDGEDEGDVFVSAEMGIPNAPPRFLSRPPQKIQGRAYLYEARATDIDGDIVTFSLAAGPEGMIVNPDTGLVEWDIPYSAFNGESYRVLLRAADAGGAETDQEYFIKLPIRK